MSAIQLIITDAGRAAMAQVGQFGPVTLKKVAIGSAGYSPSASQTSLQKEIKQLDPVGSSVSESGMIHITAQDNSADNYEIREIGLFTSTGILFAIYSQIEAILVKGSGSIALLAVDFAITNLPPGNVTIGDAKFEYPPATENTKGVAEIATQEEVKAGLDDSTFITPLKLAGRNEKKSGDVMTGPLTNPSGFIGNASSATRLQTSRSIALNGAVTGNANFDGSNNIAIQTHLTGNYVKKEGDIMNGPLTNPNGFIGNSSSSTRLQTSRTITLQGAVIGNANFDGTANVTIQTQFSGWEYLMPRLLPAGIICAFATSTAPHGWLKANGVAVSRSIYSDLFNTIGTYYGSGDGSTTFNLPDLRGEFIRGWDDGRGVNPGRGFGSVEGDELRSHNHTFNTQPASWPTASHHSQPERILTENTYLSIHSHTASWITHTGGSETRPRNIALLYCIKC